MKFIVTRASTRMLPFYFGLDDELSVNEAPCAFAEQDPEAKLENGFIPWVIDLTLEGLCELFDGGVIVSKNDSELKEWEKYPYIVTLYDDYME